MTWECAECHEPEGKRVRIDGVCHHCGKPLCRDDRVLIVDKVFMPAGEAGANATGFPGLGLDGWFSFR